jgi:hypothetical protein
MKALFIGIIVRKFLAIETTNNDEDAGWGWSTGSKKRKMCFQISRTAFDRSTSPLKDTRRGTNEFKQKITPFLWFDNNAEEAIRLYMSVLNARRAGFARQSLSHHQ